MKTRLSIIILVVAIFGIKAQTPPTELPVPVLSEVEIKTWPTDSLAEAVILSDIGESHFYTASDASWNIQFNRKTKIKIITNAGLRFANIEIPLYKTNKEKEQVCYIRGKVYNIENGEIVTSTLDTLLIYEEQADNNLTIKKLALPNVKPGSLIEYSYTILSPFKFNLPSWVFQWEIPVVKSSYTIGVIPFYEYASLIQGNLKFSSNRVWEGAAIQSYYLTKYKETFYEYEMQNIPAFRDEDFITSQADNILKIEFQLSKYTNYRGESENVMTTWKELSKELIKKNDFGKYLSDCKHKFDNKIPFATTLDTLENIKRTIEYVKKLYAWDYDYRLLPKQKLNEFINHKKGNSAEINLFALGLMNAIGIKAQPVLISTRSHGRIATAYPFVNAFNHVLILTQANNTSYIMDATDPFCPIALLPLQCINNNGYIVDNKNSDNWISLNNANPSQITHYVEMCSNATNDSMSVSLKTYAYHYDAMRLRKIYAQNPGGLKEHLLPNVQVDTFNAEDIENINNKLTISAQGEIEMDKAGQNIIIQPFIGLCATKNIFKSEQRTYAVDLTYAFQRTFKTTITIPKGYQVASSLSNTTANNAAMQFSRFESIEGDKLCITASYTLPKAVYPPEEYALLRSTFSQMVSRLNSPIILAPIGSNESAMK